MPFNFKSLCDMKVANELRVNNANAKMNIRQFFRRKDSLERCVCCSVWKKISHCKAGMISMQPECENLSDFSTFQSLNFKRAIHWITENVMGAIHAHHYQTSKAHHSKTVFSTQYCLILGIISKANA